MSALKSVSFTAVELTGGLWKGLMDTNRTQTLPIQYEQCRATGRLDALRLKWKKGCEMEHVSWDSDAAKWIEAAAHSLASHPDPDLERKVDRAIRDIEKAQMQDGYFNSHFQQFHLEHRWTNLRGNHELYCAGHLMEAAVAYWHATGKRRFLDVMIRFTDHCESKSAAGQRTGGTKARTHDLLPRGGRQRPRSRQSLSQGERRAPNRGGISLTRTRSLY